MSVVDPRMEATGRSSSTQPSQTHPSSTDTTSITSALGRLLTQPELAPPTITPASAADSLGSLPSPLPSRPTPVPSSSSSSSVYPSSSLLTIEDLHQAPSASTETLPQYSRRAPLTTSAEDEAPLKTFQFQSRSRKMSLRFDAAGERNPVLLQPEPEARSWLKGSLVLSLPSAEPITHVRIRLEGVVRTMVMKVSRATCATRDGG